MNIIKKIGIIAMMTLMFTHPSINTGKLFGPKKSGIAQELDDIADAAERIDPTLKTAEQIIEKGPGIIEKAQNFLESKTFLKFLQTIDPWRDELQNLPKTLEDVKEFWKSDIGPGIERAENIVKELKEFTTIENRIKSLKDETIENIDSCRERTIKDLTSLKNETITNIKNLAENSIKIGVNSRDMWLSTIVLGGVIFVAVVAGTVTGGAVVVKLFATKNNKSKKN